MGKKKHSHTTGTCLTMSVSDRKVLDNKKQCENYRHRLFGYWMNRHIYTRREEVIEANGDRSWIMRRIYSTPPTNPIEINIARTLIWESMGNDWRSNQTSPLEYAIHINNLVCKRLTQSSAESYTLTIQVSTEEKTAEEKTAEEKTAEEKTAEEKKQLDILERVSGIVKSGSHHTGRPCREVVFEMLNGKWGPEWTKVPRIESWCKEFALINL